MSIALEFYARRLRAFHATATPLALSVALLTSLAAPARSAEELAPQSSRRVTTTNSRAGSDPTPDRDQESPDSSSPYRTSRRAARTDKRIGEHPARKDPIARELAFQQAVLHQMTGEYSQALDAARISDEGDTGTSYLQGILLLQQKRYDEAAEILGRVNQDEDAPETTEVYLGIALINSGQLERAEEMLGTAAQNHPGQEELHYLLGVTLEYLERRKEADVQFQLAGVDAERVQTIRQASLRPATETSATEGIQADRTSLLGPADWGDSCCSVCGGNACDCNARRSDRRWNLTFLTGYEYDSNIPSAPSFVGLGDDIDKDDSRWFVAAFADYRVVERETMVAGLLASAFSNWHFDQDQFDLQDYMGGAYANMHLYGSTIGGIRYEFHDTSLGNNHLANEHRLTTNLTRFWGDYAHTTFYYEYDTVATNAPALIPAQVQSGDVNSVGATHAIYTMGGDGRIYFGYRFENADTEGADFVRDSHMVTGRFEHPLNDSLMGDVEVRYFWDDYKNPNSLDFFGRPRRDERLELRTGLQQTLNDCWSFRVDYTFITTESSVENLFGVRFFEYDRHILSTQLIYDF